jgi:prepilin-type N-terminal cleavage/methylation domain-containing protein
MRHLSGRRGVTLTELVIAAAILGIVSVAFATFLRYATTAAVKGNAKAAGQEETRQGLQKVERALVHVSRILTASPTFVEFVVDRDQSPAYDENADADGDGVPAFRDSDVDNDAQTIAPSSAAWRSGFNLTDDDDDGDAAVDARMRLYLSSGSLWFDLSVNEDAWGTRAVKLLADVSTFTFTYWGNKANSLGANIDANNDGAVSSAEMDAVLAPAGAGNADGSLDLQAERNYITTIRLDVGVDTNRDGSTEFRIETDVYPPLLVLRPLQ